MRVLAALHGGPADEAMMRQLIKSRYRLTRLSKLNLLSGVATLAGSATFLIVLALGALGKGRQEVLLTLSGLSLLVGSLGLCSIAVANYRWTTQTHQQIEAALAEETLVFEKMFDDSRPHDTVSSA